MICNRPCFSPDYTRCSPRHGTNASQSAGSYNVSAGESESDKDGRQSHPVKSGLRRRKNPIRYPSYSIAIFGIDSADEDEHRRKRRRTAMHAHKHLRDDLYEPPDSESDQDQVSLKPLRNGFSSLWHKQAEMDEDNDGICSLPSKPSRLQKASPSTRSIVP